MTHVLLDEHSYDFSLTVKRRQVIFAELVVMLVDGGDYEIVYQGLGGEHTVDVIGGDAHFGVIVAVGGLTVREPVINLLEDLMHYRAVNIGGNPVAYFVLSFVLLDVL